MVHVRGAVVVLVLVLDDSIDHVSPNGSNYESHRVRKFENEFQMIWMGQGKLKRQPNN